MSTEPLKIKSELHEAIGACMMEWAHVELFASNIFSKLAESKTPAVPEEIWRTVVAFKAKVKMTDALVKLVIKDKNLLKIWKHLNSALLSHYDLRNEIAHATIVEFKDGKNDGLFVVPYWTVGIHNNHKRMSANDIYERREKFVTLHWALGWFCSYYSFREKPEILALQPSPQWVMEHLGLNTPKKQDTLTQQ